MGFHQLQMAPLVPNFSLLRFLSSKTFFVHQKRPIFHPGSVLTSSIVFCLMKPNYSRGYSARLVASTEAEKRFIGSGPVFNVIKLFSVGNLDVGISPKFLEDSRGVVKEFYLKLYFYIYSFSEPTPT